MLLFFSNLIPFYHYLFYKIAKHTHTLIDYITTIIHIFRQKQNNTKEQFSLKTT